MLLLLTLSAGSLLADAEPAVIGEITIRTLDVFSREEAARGWGYALTNSLHVQTREGVIRNLLLFEEGDRYDPAKLEETERNLRALDFIKSASVTASSARNGVVDVEVVTQDSWTTEPGLNIGSKGGSAKFGIELTESNILGTGRYLSILYEDDPDRTKQGFRFRDPSLFGVPYWSADLLYTENSDGQEQALQIRRPFKSVDTPWAVRGEAQRLEQTSKTYAGSYVDDTFSVRSDALELSSMHAFRRSSSRAHRIGVGISLTDETFFEVEGSEGAVLPEDRRYRYLFADYQLFESDYRKLNYVNRDLRYEDFNLGTDARLRLGVSPSAFGADETTGFVGASLSRGFALGATSFLLPSVSYSSRLGTEARNAILHADTYLISRMATRRPQTFVARASFTEGRHLDRDKQFFADGDSGLRGYRLHAFEGDTTLVLNLEHRVYLGREILQIVSPGIAIFFDTGVAVPEGRPLSLDGFKSDVGIGLRFGMTRSSRNMIRMDLAWPLEPDPRGRQGLIISFSSAQAF